MIHAITSLIVFSKSTANINLWQYNNLTLVFERIFQSFLLNIFTLSQATHLSANLSFHLSNYDILIIVFTMWHTMNTTRDKICFYWQPVVKLTFWHVPLNKKWLYLQMKYWLLEALNLHIRLYLDNGFNIFYTKENSAQLSYIDIVFY